MLAVGTKLGPYKILAPLGAGGMGEVYHAHDTCLGRDVTFKVLPSHLAATPEARARFEREARTISQLNHPHICTLSDVCPHDGVDFVLVEGGQSLNRCAARGSGYVGLAHAGSRHVRVRSLADDPRRERRHWRREAATCTHRRSTMATTSPKRKAKKAVRKKVRKAKVKKAVRRVRAKRAVRKVVRRARVVAGVRRRRARRAMRRTERVVRRAVRKAVRKVARKKRVIRRAVRRLAI